MVMKKTLSELMKSSDNKKGMTERQISIISAAIEIISEKGYEATTTSEIAKKANVAEGTIFRYYKTKKDLLLAIPECLFKVSLFQSFREDINEVLESNYENFEDFLRSLILNRQKFAKENMPILKIIFQELPFHPELRETILNTVGMPTLGKMTEIFDKFKEKGQMIDIPSAFLVRMMATSIIGYFFSQYVLRLSQSVNEEEEIEYLIKYIMNSVCKPNPAENNNTLS
jgi:AcrR family transcriptional regulator